MTVLLETNLPNPLFSRGKVRDSYVIGDHLLMIATDRISAFDVILPCGIPDKGAVLNKISSFWFEKTAHLIPNHVIQVVDRVDQLDAYRPAGYSYPAYLDNRSMIVRKAKRLPVECVVRGYLCGSAWAEYTKCGRIHGITAPSGLKDSQKLPEPIFTPTTKEDDGHDQPLMFDELIKLVGESLAEELKEKTIAVYRFAEEYARSRGIIIADTKMEFGIIDNKVTLIDELLTPDSSRFWDLNSYKVGRSQPSFDKQIVRDWLSSSRWNKEPPAPVLPDDLIQRTSQRYREVYQILTGRNLYN